MGFFFLQFLKSTSGCFFYYVKCWNVKRYFMICEIFWHLMWICFCYFDGTNSIKTDLQNCNLWTNQSQGFLFYNVDHNSSKMHPKKEIILPFSICPIYKSILIKFFQHNFQKHINVKKFTFHIVEETPSAEAKTSETIYSSRRIGNDTKNLWKHERLICQFNWLSLVLILRY